MDDQQCNVLRLAFQEAYLCLRDRNRPQVMVEGQVIYSDAELATAIRLFAHRLLAVQAEHECLVREVRLLWEAQMSGALERLLDAVEQVQVVEVGGWHEPRDAPAVVLHEPDLQILRALVSVPDEGQVYR
jgi:hypothetical protein